MGIDVRVTRFYGMGQKSLRIWFLNFKRYENLPLYDNWRFSLFKKNDKTPSNKCPARY